MLLRMVLSSSVKEGLEQAVMGPVLWDAPLSAWTTFRVGGPAEALVTVNETEELQSVLSLCKEHEISWKLLGRGSNIVVSDHGFDGIIVILGDGFKSICRKDIADSGRVLVHAGGAISLSRLGDWTAEQGLSGLEFAAGIPGSLGGALVMNAGAWGSEIGDLVYRVTLAGDNEKRMISAGDLNFGYRCWHDIYESLYDFVVTDVELRLAVAETIEVQQKMREYRRQRRERQPVGMPNAGSFFKNPPGQSAGRLIESSNLKGMRVGGAEVSGKHANFFVNRGNATASDIIQLMRLVQDRVKKDSGIALEPEVQFL